LIQLAMKCAPSYAS